MLNLWRNPEVKRSLLIAVILSVIIAIMSSVLSLKLAFVITVTSLFWHVYYLFEKYKRYQKISDLSSDLDKILNDNRKLKLEDYTEGELSILASSVEKILTRLHQQQDLLTHDKHFLAESLADISHQLRTPLASLNLLFDRLKQPNLSKAEQQFALRDIYRLLNQLERLIDNLLIMSKLDAGAIIFNREKHSVKELLNKAIQPLEIRLELKEVDLHLELEGELECDLFWTAEALTNILKNCLEHCNKSGEIIVSSEQNPLYTEIFIADNGQGFSEADLPNLFNRFYRGENAAPDSIGIGLALARQIIHDQDGTLKAENNLSGGALFIIRFYS